MRICFLVQDFVNDAGGMITGAQVQVSLLAQEMRRRGHEVCVVTGGDRRGRAPDHLGIPVHVCRAHRHFPVLTASNFLQAVRDLAPDVVYVRGRSYLTGVAALLQRQTGAVFVWASNGEDGCERWKRLHRLGKSARPASRKILRAPFDVAADLMCDAGVGRAGACVCQTAHQIDRLSAGHGREGVIIRTLQAAPSATPPRDTPPVVLWIGRVTPDRRPEPFVELAAELADADCEFVLVGPAAGSAYLEQVVAPATGLPRFRYIGPVSFDDSWAWIARASILVNTSLVEGISNALVQAWACGTPTVALSFDPDGLIQRSGAGMLSGDLATLARDVRRLLDDPEARAACGRRARELAETEFSAAAVGDAYEAVMRKAAGGV